MDWERYWATQPKTVGALIRTALPGVQFLIIGSHVPPSVLALESPDVIIRGYVQDPAPIFDSCRLSVALIRYGAGVKGKVTHTLVAGQVAYEAR